MTEDYFVNEAVGALPENFKNDAQTKVTLAGADVMIAANPNFAPLIYKRETQKWEELSFVDRQELPWESRP